MRFEQTFQVSRSPEVVFDYLTNPAHLPDWQTRTTSVETLTEGPLRQGTRVRERLKGPGGKQFDQVVEFTHFDRPRCMHLHIVEGPYRVDGKWTFESEGAATRVHFVGQGQLNGMPRLLQPLMKLMIARQMASHHRNLRRNLERAA